MGLQSYLIRDEPGCEARFSYKMSLEEKTRMLGIDHQHGDGRTDRSGADPSFFGSQR